MFPDTVFKQLSARNTHDINLLSTFNARVGVIPVDASGGNRIVSLPNASLFIGREFYIRKIDLTSNTVIINCLCGNLPNLQLALNIPYSDVWLRSTGDSWILIHGSEQMRPLPFIVSIFYPGTLATSTVITKLAISRNVIFPVNLVSSVVTCGVNPSGNYRLGILKNSVEVGDISFSINSASWTTTSPELILNSGDTLSILSSIKEDSLISDVSITLEGTR
jgi:hypothetical protein